MDHVVHINNGSGAARPIVLRLLPGEETIFNLKVVNHGEPSSISLQASNPVFKAVHLKKPDHYVTTEETIPILARMPANKKRLDGEILLSGDGRESRVPITLLLDSEDPGDDLEDPGQQEDEELKDDLMGEALEREDADDENDGGDEDEDGEKEKVPRPIAFSRDQDLQRYRSATRQRRVAGAPERRGNKRVQERAGRRADDNDEYSYDRSNAGSDDRNGYGGDSYRGREDEIESFDEDDDNRFETRFDTGITRIDDRFVDKSNRLEESPRFKPRQIPPPEKEERQRFTTGYEEERHQEYRGHQEDQRYQGYQGFRQELDSESQEILTSAERAERAPEEPEEYVEQEEEGPLPSQLLDNLGGFGALGALQVIPATIFLALVIVLVLTFITESIPEFPGALASSILIVTLIIYGAATLLKA